MRIDKIASSTEYRMDEHFKKFPIFRAKSWFSKLEEFKNFIDFANYKIIKISQILQFRKSSNFHY